MEFFGDEVDRISEINAVSGIAERYVDHVAIYPASHYVASKEKLQRAMVEIQRECDDQVAFFRAHDKLIEAQRIAQRTAYDLEMLTEIGFCNGIENYSRVIQGRAPGTPPTTLLDYFPKDYLMFIDESHVTLPQCRAMYAGDRSRKDALVNYGFRLPSAYDNRPLNFPEFDRKINQVIYVSATPGDYERTRSGQTVEQVIRPTGLLDPEVEVRPIEGQIDDLIGGDQRPHRQKRACSGDDPDQEDGGGPDGIPAKAGIKVRYMHSDIGAMERMEIIRDMRMGKFDVLVGINLLREDSICRRSVWWPFWTRTRRASCEARPASFRPLAAPPGTPGAGLSCTPTRSPPPCVRPSTRQPAAGRFRMPTTKPTGSSRRPSSSPCGT